MQLLSTAKANMQLLSTATLTLLLRQKNLRRRSEYRQPCPPLSEQKKSTTELNTNCDELASIWWPLGEIWVTEFVYRSRWLELILEYFCYNVFYLNQMSK